VSVRNANEARLALRGGCDILDIKEPTRGSLGMADISDIAAVVRARNDQASGVPLSVALGEAVDWVENIVAVPPLNSACATGFERTVEPLAARFRRAGLPRALPASRTSFDYAKLGTAGLTGCELSSCFRQARRRCEQFVVGPRWIAVAYADWRIARAPAPDAVMSAAAACGWHGVLIDTWGKAGRRLFDWLSVDALHELVGAARRRGLSIALAGRLSLGDIERLCTVAPDIVGIRSAACRDARRDGPIDADRVEEFRHALSRT
jgi:uncharacterized protein (UPF0264 family)